MLGSVEEIRSVAELEQVMSSVHLSFEDVTPAVMHEWMQTFSASHGTTRELLLLSSLTSTSALIGNTSLEVFPSYEEKGNLFIVAVAPSGAGKSPASYYGCIGPIVQHLEGKIMKSIVLDETSANGLFNHFVSGSSTVPILCLDEAFSFLTKISSASKSGHINNVTMERLCKCFDGDCWYVLKGNKGKRSGIPSARLSLIALTTPRQFLEKVWPKIIDAENGLAERILFFFQKSSPRDLEETAVLCEQLQNFHLKSFSSIFEQIFVEHNTDAEPVIYKLNASAKEAFFKFSKPPNYEEQASQVTIQADCHTRRCTNSKRNKHVLRLALNMHILYDRITKALSKETGPTARVINLDTMNMAITMVETLETLKGISEVCCQLKPNDASTITVGVPSHDISKRVLEMNGPFTTARLVYTSFSSKSRPPVTNVQKAMEDLEKSGLGHFKVINKLKVFYKKEPIMDLKPQLSEYGITYQAYSDCFQKVGERLTSRNREAMEENNPYD